MGLLYSSNSNAARSFNILLIEDNEEDAFLFQKSLRSLAIGVTRVSDGAGAILRLSRHDRLPDLIVLDMNLTGLSSEEFLDWVETKPEISRIPVCIFTGASIIDGSLKKRVRAAFLKTLDPAEIRTKVEEMCAYAGAWRLPMILKLAGAAAASALFLEAA